MTAWSFLPIFGWNFVSSTSLYVKTKSEVDEYCRPYLIGSRMYRNRARAITDPNNWQLSDVFSSLTSMFSQFMENGQLTLTETFCNSLIRCVLFLFPCNHDYICVFDIYVMGTQLDGFAQVCRWTHDGALYIIDI